MSSHPLYFWCLTVGPFAVVICEFSKWTWQKDLISELFLEISFQAHPIKSGTWQAESSVTLRTLNSLLPNSSHQNLSVQTTLKPKFIKIYPVFQWHATSRAQIPTVLSYLAMIRTQNLWFPFAYVISFCYHVTFKLAQSNYLEPLQFTVATMITSLLQVLTCDLWAMPSIIHLSV